MFEIGGDTAVLEFGEGTPLAGAVVRVSLDMSVRQFLDLQRTVNAIRKTVKAVGDDATDEASFDQWESAYKQFAETALLSWDLSRKDRQSGELVAISADFDGFMSLPFAIANAIFIAWSSALSEPSPNSSAVSGDGASSEADGTPSAAAS